MTSTRSAVLALFAAAASVVTTPNALAEKGILLSSGKDTDSSSLATGEQLVLTSLTVTMPFAGRQIELSGFTGIVGYSNELAYVVVLDGAAAAGDVRAEAGRLLILRPYGAPATAERFDAIRLIKKWSDTAKTAAPAAYASLGHKLINCDGGIPDRIEF